MQYMLLHSYNLLLCVQCWLTPPNLWNVHCGLHVHNYIHFANTTIVKKACAHYTTCYYVCWVNYTQTFVKISPISIWFTCIQHVTGG